MRTERSAATSSMPEREAINSIEKNFSAFVAHEQGDSAFS